MKISARDSRYTDPKQYLNAIFRQWLPLSDAVLVMVANKLPSPLDVSEERIEKLMCGGLRKFDSLPSETRELKKGIKILAILCTRKASASLSNSLKEMFTTRGTL